MAAGDTTPGDIRIKKRTLSGSEIVLTSGIDSVLADPAGTGSQYINMDPGQKRAEGDRVRKLLTKFQEKERIILEIASSIAAAEQDYDLVDSIGIEILEEDLNTGVVTQKTLRVSDTNLSANPTTIINEYVKFFEYVVTGRVRIQFGGLFRAISGTAA